MNQPDSGGRSRYPGGRVATIVGALAAAVIMTGVMFHESPQSGRADGAATDRAAPTCGTDVKPASGSVCVRYGEGGQLAAVEFGLAHEITFSAISLAPGLIRE